MLKEFKGYKKGVDLGGWLSQCDHQTATYENFIKEEDFKIIAGWGLDHVRVPVDYELVEDDQGAYLEGGFAYIQRAIDWCKKYGLNMILDLHKTYGYSFDDGYGENGFFENEAFQERFYKLWEQFAKRFASNRDMLSFELLNEVTDKEYGPIWNRISNTCIERIRKIDANVTILIGGYWNNGVDAVKDLEPPHDEHIVYNFHCYEPILFTHQGAYWVKGMPVDYRISYKAPIGAYTEAIKKYIPMFMNDSVANLNPNAPHTAEFFKKRFAEAVRVATERGVPLYCGEYGVIELADPEDEVEWFKQIHEAFEEYGIGRAAWSYRGMDFGLIDARLDGVRDRLIPLL